MEKDAPDTTNKMWLLCRKYEEALDAIADIYENTNDDVTVGERAAQAYDMRCVARRALGQNG